MEEMLPVRASPRTPSVTTRSLTATQKSLAVEVEPISDVLDRLREKIIREPTRFCRKEENPQEKQAEDLGIPRLYWLASRQSFREEDFAEKDGRRYTPPASGPMNLLITSLNPGSGKTWLAAALAKEWGGRWTSAHAMLEHTDFRGKPLIDSTLAFAKVIIIDQLDSAINAPWKLEWWTAFLEGRLSACRYTVITSQVTHRRIVERSQTLAAKLGCFRKVHLIAPDRRQGANGHPPCDPLLPHGEGHSPVATETVTA